MLSLILISISLGLSNFAAAIGIGLNGVNNKTRLHLGIIFGLFEGIMPVVGLLIGHTFAESVGRLGNYIGAALLVLIGMYVIYSGSKVNNKKNSQHRKSTNFIHLVLTGFAVSLDNLVVGFALSFYHRPIIQTGLTMALVSVTMSLIGLEMGNKLGERFEKWSEELGGIVLIFVGIFLGLGLI